MATCKDCVHFVVCDSGRHIGEYIKDDGVYTDGVEKECFGFKDKALTMDLPCKIGTHLWRVTYPYRQEPKVTEYVVKNFRTIGKKHQLQIEVQAVNVPVTNWMRYQDFCTTREEAEDHLRKMYAIAEELKAGVEALQESAETPEINYLQYTFKMEEDHG